jgi:RNAse (barnase) inhibitor barstar
MFIQFFLLPLKLNFPTVCDNKGHQRDNFSASVEVLIQSEEKQGLKGGL